MKIKLAILEADKSYLSKLAGFLGVNYTDKIEVYSFSNSEVALSTVESAKIDVFLANASFEITKDMLPKRCGFAVLVEKSGIESVKGVSAIFKYQKIDLIYKQILGIYAESSVTIGGIKADTSQCKIIAVTSASGGVGSSSVAAACAMHCAKRGKSVLYLDIDPFGQSDLFFSAEGVSTMSDVVFAVKSKKTNISLKLESCARQDDSGVFYFAPAPVALDVMELSAEEIGTIIQTSRISGNYDYMVIDTAFSPDKNGLDILRLASSILFVGDGSRISNTKTVRVMNALSILEQDSDAPIADRVLYLYNRASSRQSQHITEIPLNVIGNMPKYDGADEREIIKALADLDVFDAVL